MEPYRLNHTDRAGTLAALTAANKYGFLAPSGGVEPSGVCARRDLRVE